MKEQQKQNLIDMMKDDEKLGLYNETLEEVAERYVDFWFENGDKTEEVFIAGAKWQEQKTTDLLQQNTELLEALKELTSMCYKLKIQHVSNKVKICLEAKEELIQKHKTK